MGVQCAHRNRMLLDRKNTRIAELETENARLRDVIADAWAYTRHEPRCERDFETAIACNCGYEALAKRLDKALEAKP